MERPMGSPERRLLAALVEALDRRAPEVTKWTESRLRSWRKNADDACMAEIDAALQIMGLIGPDPDEKQTG